VTERLIIVDHVLFVVEDFPASRRLFTAALAPLRIEELNEEPNCISYGRQQLDDFSICEGSPVTTASHVAFDAADRQQVDAFFEAALAAGATTRGEPGVWIQYSDRYYAAFVNDLYGNNVEAVFHSPVPVTDATERGGAP
jgi:catechol 2,3-dioxygenase-like lactoylglutathione lyase family enzyme